MATTNGATIDLSQVRLPDERPATITERDWMIARGRFGPPEEQCSLAELQQAVAAQFGISITRERIRQLEAKLAYKLLYPEFGELPGYVRMALIDEGFHSGAEVQAAADHDLLSISGLGAKGLAQIRARFPRLTTDD